MTGKQITSTHAKRSCFPVFAHARMHAQCIPPLDAEPSTKRKLDFIESAHGMVSNEKDPEASGLSQSWKRMSVLCATLR